jgi:hypothetical protein
MYRCAMMRRKPRPPHGVFRTFQREIGHVMVDENGGHNSENRPMWHLYRDLTRYFHHMGPEEYLMLLALVVVLGLLCLRGFGSRSKY